MQNEHSPAEAPHRRITREAGSLFDVCITRSVPGCQGDKFGGRVLLLLSWLCCVQDHPKCLQVTGRPTEIVNNRCALYCIVIGGSPTCEVTINRIHAQHPAGYRSYRASQWSVQTDLWERKGYRDHSHLPDPAALSLRSVCTLHMTVAAQYRALSSIHNAWIPDTGSRPPQPSKGTWLQTGAPRLTGNMCPPLHFFLNEL